MGGISVSNRFQRCCPRWKEATKFPVPLERGDAGEVSDEASWCLWPLVCVSARL